MLVVYHGEDDYSRVQALRELRENLGDPDVASLNSTVISARDANPAAVIAQASAIPFLGPGRLVVVEGLLATFESRRSLTDRATGARTGRRRTGASAQTDPEAGLGGWEAVASTAQSLPSSNSLVFSDGVIADSNPLLKMLTPLAQVRRFRTFNSRETVDWIRRRVLELGSHIEPDAVDELGDSVGGNLWALDAELSKMALYAGDRAITLEDIAELGTLAKQETIFALVDAVVDGRYGQARIHLERMLNAGETGIRIVDTIGRQFRQLIIVKDLTSRNASKDQLADGMGTRSDFAVRKTVAQAGSFSMNQLIEMHGRLLAHDIAFKSGKMDEMTSLELLLLDLCRVAASGKVA